MKAIGLFSTLVLISILSFGQINQLGHPIIRNYTPEEYKGSEQSWAIIQDNRGVMYFGNNDRILEYDGISWRSIAVPKNAPVRSFAKDDKGTIYVGTVGDFGYLVPGKNNSLLEFKSLADQLKDSIVKNKIQDIYKTHFFNNKVYFCSRQSIIVYDGNSVKSVDLGDQSVYSNFWTFIVNNRIYIGSYLKGLREFQNDTTIIISKGGSFYEEKSIFSMVPLSSTNVLMITNSGLFTYNQETGESTEFTPKNSYLNKLIGNSLPYSGLALENKSVGIGTVIADQPTYVTVNQDGTPVDLVNIEIGLKDNFVYNQYQNSNSSLWLAQDLGLAKVEVQSAIHKFDEHSGLTGVIYDIIRFNGKLYVATNTGAFYLTFNKMGIPRFYPIDGLKATTTSCFLIYKIPGSSKEILLVGAQPGLFEIKGTSLKEIKFNDFEFQCYKIFQSKSNPSRIYVGMSGGLIYVDFINGKWIDGDYILKDDIKDEIRSIEEDFNGNLWLATYVNGLIEIKKNNKKLDLIRFGLKEGLPSLNNISLYNFDNKLIATTSNGIYQFDDSQKRFIPSKLLKQSESREGKGINIIANTPSGYAYTKYKESTICWVETFDKDNTGKGEVTSIPFKYLPSKWVNVIFPDNDGIIWFGIQKELYSYNPKIKRDYNIPFNALVRRVLSKEDTVLFNGNYCQKVDNNKYIVSLIQQNDQVPKFQYRFNKLVFEFGSTFYEKEEDTQFSYFLEGSDETWSIWNKEAKATYTNLREGSYTFKVKSRNIYGYESAIGVYKFSLAPPWYRTIFAYIIYFLFFIAFVWFLVRWNTRRLIAEKEELEEIVKERTAEVVAQKDEIEAQNEKISIQNEEIKSSIHYASRIQGAILTPNEQIDQIFKEYFILFLPRDIVSGDFYWITKVGSKKICVVADCTGHGVPGGFMSMLGMSFISQIISKGGTLHPGDILNQLRSSVINSLHQTGEVGGSKDGMDIAIYVIDEDTNILEFSGANNPLVHIRNNELNHIKSDKMPIGIHMRANEPFATHTIELQPGDCLYTFSDGYVDQFGGPDQRKFMIKNFKELLLEIHKLPMAEQREKLHKTLLDWHGDSPRIDDVVVMGVRI